MILPDDDGDQRGCNLCGNENEEHTNTKNENLATAKREPLGLRLSRSLQAPQR
jgi:hypothetical protein